MLCFIPGAVPENFQRGLEVDVEVKLYEVNVNPGILFRHAVVMGPPRDHTYV